MIDSTTTWGSESGSYKGTHDFARVGRGSAISGCDMCNGQSLNGTKQAGYICWQGYTCWQGYSEGEGYSSAWGGTLRSN